MALVPGLHATPAGHTATSVTQPTSSRNDFFFSIAYPNTHSNLQTGHRTYGFDVKAGSVSLFVFVSEKCW